MSIYLENYVAFLKSHIHLNKPITVVADCSNGSTGAILVALTDVPNLTLKLINEKPDGNFPAHSPNPLEPGALNQLTKAVLNIKADFGVAFDADGDRAFFIDEKGNILPGFLTCVLLFKNNKPPYVIEETVYQALKHLKLFKDTEIKPTKVGSLFIKEGLKEFKGSTGGEYSGHYYFDKFFGLDSGIFAFVEVANVVSHMTTSLSSFVNSIPAHTVINENVRIEGKNAQEILKKIESIYQSKAEIGHRDGITLDLGNTWINIRTSNTEPLLRLLAGASTEKETKKLIAEVKALV
jgi:phosphomannomutase